MATATSLVREARQRAGLSQAELAVRAGVPQSTVGPIESGAREPSAALVERLIRAAGFELRVGLGEPDREPTRYSNGRCAATPQQRLGDATRAARFALRGRRAMSAARAGRAVAVDGENPPSSIPCACSARSATAEVEFILVGGMAAILHGDVGVTGRRRHRARPRTRQPRSTRARAARARRAHPDRGRTGRARLRLLGRLPAQPGARMRC